MPAPITHYLQSRRTLNSVGCSDFTPADLDAFSWGAQGPSFLLHAKGKQSLSLRKFGLRLCRADPASLLNDWNKASAQSPDDLIQCSYFLGLVCFYSMERTSAPFVHAQSLSLHRLHPEYPWHFCRTLVETSLDIIILRYERAILPTNFPLPLTAPKDKAVQEKIAGLYSAFSQELYGTAVDKESVLVAEQDYRRFLRLQTDSTGLKRLYFERKERKNGKFRCSCCFRGIMEDGDFDYANIQGGLWLSQDGQESHCTTFLDLYEDSIEKSTCLMKKFPEI
jgi:hypothetical protein